jgi:uncharacterized membrane protein
MRDVREMEAEARRLAELLPHGRPPKRTARNINSEHEASFSALDRLALFITERVGTMGFFVLVAVWMFGWVLWNVLPGSKHFDPGPAFVILLLGSNFIQLLLMPLIMVGQNLQGRHSELRAVSDFDINQKAEAEVETILQHLEAQNEILQQLTEFILAILRRIEPEGQAGPRAAVRGRPSVTR